MTGGGGGGGSEDGVLIGIGVGVAVLAVLIVAVVVAVVVMVRRRRGGFKAQDILSPNCRRKKNAYHKYTKDIAMTDYLVILYSA